jgi:hypothetical protein
VIVIKKKLNGMVPDKCGKCGAKVSPGYDFCLTCGTKFSEIPPTYRVHDSAKSALNAAAGTAIFVDEVGDCLGCFIATAAYGSHLSPQVKFLRDVRDKKLKASRLGTLFVDRFESIYYKFSPDVAKVMYRYPLFKQIMKWVLVTPIVYFLMSIFRPINIILP